MNKIKRISSVPPCFEPTGNQPKFCRPSTDNREQLHKDLKQLKEDTACEVIKIMPESDMRIQSTIASKAIQLCWNKGMSIQTSVQHAIKSTIKK